MSKKNEYHESLKENCGEDKRSVVIHCKNERLVRKYYDTQYHNLPSDEAIKFIPEAIFNYSVGGRLQILQYPYLEGTRVFESV